MLRRAFPVSTLMLLLIVFTVSSLPLLPTSHPITQTTFQSAPTKQAPPTPAPAPSMLLREYVFPMMTTGMTRFPHGITHDDQGYIWGTDYIHNRIYRVKPAAINETLTIGWEWELPAYFAARGPAHIIVDNAATSVWFTNRLSGHVSRLDWTTNFLWDYYVAPYNIIPWDLVRTPDGLIWFTSFNSSSFCMLNQTNALHIYQAPVAGPAPIGLLEIATNGTSLYMNDIMQDILWEAPIWAFTATGVLGYPITPNGGAGSVEVDHSNNVWVTQMLSDVINEQIAGSTPKTSYDPRLDVYLMGIEPEVIPRNTLEIPIQTTPVLGTVFSTPPNITGDPLAAWFVPTYPSWPLGIRVDNGDYMWFTEPIDNKIGVIDPSKNETWEFPITTPNSLPLYMTIPEDDHVWFTEYVVGKFGELFNTSFIDVRVCPSIPPQFPPPLPGSIRWTWEPGAEIWVDAPSNGYDPTHHDAPEQGTSPNRLYAKVKNLGSQTAINLLVKFYYHNMSLGFGSWIPLPPIAPNPAHWIHIGTATIASLAPLAEVDVYVDWIIGTNISIHQCVGVQVTAPGEFYLYDNVAYRNFIVVTTTPGTTITPIPIYITNTLQVAGRVQIALSGVDYGWLAWINDEGFDLEPGETRKVHFHLQVPETAQQGMRKLIQITASINDQVTGHVWVQVHVVATSSISLRVSPTTILLDGVVFFTGAITPTRPGVQVYVHITQPDGATYNIGGLTDTYGAYNLSTGLNSKAGDYSVYAFWLGDSNLLGATSPVRNYTVSLLPPGIPGYPLEAVLVGVFSALMMIFVVRRRSKRKQ